MKIKLINILLVFVSIILIIIFVEKRIKTKFDTLENELLYLKNDHEIIKSDLDTLKYRTDTILTDVKDLKVGQKYIYDEVKKKNSINFLDLFN